MNRMARLFSIAVFGCILLLYLVPSTSNATPPDTWFTGAERAIFGRTFSEHIWTNDSIFFENENGTVRMIMSYVNHSSEAGSFEAGLLALGEITTENGTVTLPYQLFMMHFTTPTGREYFVASILAFLYAYNDSNPQNNYPDEDEDLLFIIPFGAAVANETWAPEVSAIPATDLEPGHYRFGISYSNLYALMIPAQHLALIMALRWTAFFVPIIIARFSELTITYDIQVNSTSGEITTETHYTIGQVTELYLFIFGIPFELDPSQITEEIGIGVTHLVAVVGTNYNVEEGNTSPNPASQWIQTNITDPQGRERALGLGVQGSYDLYNETSATYFAQDLPAYSWILEPSGPDLLLVLWQLPLTIDLVTTFAYALSSSIQSQYEHPLDLLEHATNRLSGGAFWYSIAFPQFRGLRVEHDPVYTAYSNVGQIGPKIPTWLGLVLVGSVSLIALIVLVLVVIRINGRNNRV